MAIPAEQRQKTIDEKNLWPRRGPIEEEEEGSTRSWREKGGMVAVLAVLVLIIAVVWAQLSEKIPEWRVEDGELVQLVNELRLLDENKARPGQIRLAYQGHTNTRDISDNAKDPLFTKVDSALLRKETYESFITLLNNFNRETGVEEVETAQKRDEVSTFVSAILKTKPWIRLFDFLQQKKHPFAKNAQIFRAWIIQLWFSRYSRARGQPDSSGFEHVFIGETKNGEVSGLHNWLRFYLLERDSNARFDYKGFVVKRFDVMAAVKYSWMNELKRSGSFIIGTSPEFDMAMYTLCFLARRGRQTCDVEMNGCPLSITSYDLIQQRKVYIGTIYPSAGRITDSCRRNNG